MCLFSDLWHNINIFLFVNTTLQVYLYLLTLFISMCDSFCLCEGLRVCVCVCVSLSSSFVSISVDVYLHMFHHRSVSLRETLDYLLLWHFIHPCDSPLWNLWEDFIRKTVGKLLDFKKFARYMCWNIEGTSFPRHPDWNFTIHCHLYGSLFMCAGCHQVYPEAFQFPFTP